MDVKEIPPRSMTVTDCGSETYQTAKYRLLICFLNPL